MNSQNKKIKNLNRDLSINDSNVRVPSFVKRVYSVWLRHYKVYTKHIISNGLPAFMEPVFFLIAIGIGLGQYVVEIDGRPYILYLASGILVPPAMYTSAYECTFGAFIRLEYDKVYDSMLSSSISAKDLLIGEIIFAGTKGLFFSTCVLLIISLFGLVSLPMAFLAPIGGFLTGVMFGALSLLVTSFVSTINHFSFYFTGLLTPMFFFSGIVFPLDNIPVGIRWISGVLPLTHLAKVVRAFCLNKFNFTLVYDLIYIVVFIVIIGFFAIKRLEKRLVN